MNYTLYRITNKLNGKVYIGCHKTDNIDDGYMGSGRIIKQALKRYGKENFDKEILHICDSAEQMFDMESAIVNEEFVAREDTYNLRTGGAGSPVTYLREEHKRKISESMMGLTKGTKQTAEHKLKRSLAQLGRARGPQERVVCPSCNKEGGISNMTRYHFEKCSAI